MKTLGCIHTSMVFVTVETMMSDIFAEVMPDVRLVNIIDDSLLPDVMAAGTVTEAATRRMCLLARAAEIAGCDAALSLCSSLGPSIDTARKETGIPIVKIDDAMCLAAARDADRIGVMATVPTTLGPTVDLVHEKAGELGREVSVERCLVEGAFEKLMAGEKDRHDRMVQDAATRIASMVDVIVFAQASMTRLAPGVADLTGLQVLTSPRLGIEHTARILRSLDSREGAA